MEWKTLRTFDNYFSAHLAKNLLDVAQIPNNLTNEELVTMNWLYGNAVGGIGLQVMEEDYDKALLVIEEYELLEEQMPADNHMAEDEDLDQLDPDNRICIHCGSKNTRRREFKKRTAFFSILLLGFPTFLNSNKWYCYNCGNEFS